MVKRRWGWGYRWALRALKLLCMGMHGLVDILVDVGAEHIVVFLLR